MSINITNSKENSNGEYLKPKSETIPEALKTQGTWINWYLDDTRASSSGKPTKVPYNPILGRQAKTNDPGTWLSFDEALQQFVVGRNYESAKRGVKFAVEGIGFVVTGDIVGVDLDKCRDPHTGQLQDWATEVVKRFDSYTEISPSKTGIRIICRGEIKGERNRKGSVEIYDRNSPRYLTITGHILDGSRITVETRQEAIDWLYGEYLYEEPSEAPEASEGHHDCPTSIEDVAIIERCRAAANGDKFAQLFDDGDWELAGYTSQSEADSALAAMIAFWTGPDRDRIARIFADSGLYRPKWDRVDYQNSVLDFACGLDRYFDWTHRLEAEAERKANQIVGSDYDFEYIAQAKEFLPSDDEMAEMHQRAEELKKKKEIDNLFPVFRYSTFDRSKRYKQIVEGTIYEQSLVLLYGPTSSLKSFLALDWAISIALGLEWNGKRTRRSKVIYIYAEAANNLWDRITAWFTAKGIEVPEDFDEWFIGIPCEVKLDVEESRDNLLKTIKHHDLGFDVVFVDTVDRNMIGIEDQLGMKGFLDSIKLLLRQMANTFVLIHHTGKDVARGSKGDSRLPSGADSIFQLLRNGTPENRGKTIKLTCEKQKVQGEGDPAYFGFNIVETGDHDEYGKPITSLALFPSTAAEFETKANAELSPCQAKVFASLNGFAATDDANVIKGGLTHHQLVADTGYSKSAVSKAINLLVKSGLIAEREIDKRRFFWRPIVENVSFQGWQK